MTGRREFCAGMLLAGSAWPGILTAETRLAKPPALRVAISAMMLGEVNENDARASMRAWAAELSRQGNMDVNYVNTLMFDTKSLLTAIRQGQLDVFGVTLHEYLQIADYVDPTMLVVDESTMRAGHEYFVLVHREKGIRGFAGLRGHTAVTFRNPMMSLASDWLDTILGAEAPAEQFFSRITSQSRLSRVVLPVYFQQVDCCLTTARGFATMRELNPQLGRQLEVVARSPKVVPSVLAFHRRCPPASRDGFIAALTKLHGSTAGKQVLALFQCDRLFVTGASILQPSIELAAAADRARAKTRKARS